MQDEEIGFPLALLLALLPFSQLFLLSASLAAFIIADRTFSLLVTVPSAVTAVTVSPECWLRRQASHHNSHLGNACFVILL